MADWSRLEQKFEDGFEKLYKLLGLPFERNEFLNADFSVKNNSCRSENFSNTTTKSEGKQNWNSSSYVLVNDQTMAGNDEPVQQTPFMEERKVEEKDAESIPSVRLIASESKPKKEVKIDEVIDEDLVLIDSEEFTNEAWEAIADALKVANILQQKAETEHLLKALLEQNQGLVPHVLTEVSIDPTFLLQITTEFINSQPKNMDESGSVFGPELKALLYRAKEWKEEYRDSLISTEHLLLGFNLDNRIGKQLYKEGNAADISFKILDAIEVMRKSQVFMNQEKTCEVLKNHIDRENQEYIDARVMEVTKFHQASVLNESSIKMGKVNECKNGLGELANYGAKVSTCKGLVAYEVEHCVIEEQSAEVNLIRLISSEPTSFDKMSKRNHYFCNTIIVIFFGRKKLNMTLDLLKKMKKKNVIAWTSLARLRHIRSGGPNLVKFFYEMLNASTDFSLRRIDRDWWGYDFVVVWVRETLAIRQLEKIFRDVAVLMMNYIDQIRSQDFETDCLNIRGGLGIDSYHIGVIVPGPRDLIDIVHELVLLQNLKIIMGPRKLVRASTCYVVNHVTRVKTDRANQFIAIEGSIEGNYVVSLTDFFKRIIKSVWNSKFEVRRTLRNGDLLNYANVICSLLFDRDEDSIVTAEFTRKTKVFVFDPGGSQARKVNSLTLLMKMQQTILTHQIWCKKDLRDNSTRVGFGMTQQATKVGLEMGQQGW